MWNTWRATRPLIVLALALLATFLTAASYVESSDALRVYEFAQVHMGMPVRLRFYAPDAQTAQRAASTAFARIATLDAMMSDYRDDSELRKLTASSGAWVLVSPELFAVLSRAVEVARASEGAFDPTVGPLVQLWRDARTRKQLPARDALEAARARVGWHSIGLDPGRSAVRLDRPGLQLDLGGIAKGYILQQAIVSLANAGIARALVEAGGDIAVGDAPPDHKGWRIDVDGADPAFAARAARLTHASLATSGPAMQFVEIDGVRYSHVIDSRTGLGLTNRVTARVIASDGATADALATALTILEPRDARRLQSEFPGVLISIETPVVASGFGRNRSPVVSGSSRTRSVVASGFSRTASSEQPAGSRE